MFVRASNQDRICCISLFATNGLAISIWSSIWEYFVMGYFFCVPLFSESMIPRTPEARPGGRQPLPRWLAPISLPKPDSSFSFLLWVCECCHGRRGCQRVRRLSGFVRHLKIVEYVVMWNNLGSTGAELLCVFVWNNFDLGRQAESDL